MNNNRKIVWYHGGCPDGIAGAWCFRLRFGIDIDCTGVKHNEPPPYQELDKYTTVYMVDFSYSRDEILKVASICKRVVILDHHKSAERELEGLDNIPNIICIFDMDRSGAQIAWEFLFLDSRPWFIDYIADRDLWRWSLDGAREICEGMHYMNMFSFEKLSELHDTKQSKEYFYNIGKSLLEYKKKRIDKVVNSSALYNFFEYKVRMANCDYELRSEVGNEMCALGDCDFSVVWTYSLKDDQWWLSLRLGDSKDDYDLSIIAKRFGGGGHPRASGMTIHGPKSPLYDLENTTMLNGTILDYFEPIN